MSSFDAPAQPDGLHPRLTQFPPGTPIPGPDGARLYAYTGSSMFPTLRALDFMEVRPSGRQPLRRGDVILFSPPDGSLPENEVGCLIVHRVIEILPGSLRTRGDNNGLDDPWLVQPAQIIGRVVAARRGAKTIPVPGGRYGLARLFCAKLLRKVWRRAGILARRSIGEYPAFPGGQGCPPYAIPRSLLYRLPSRFHPRRVVFASPRGPVTRLLLGKKVIGEYSPGERRWRIRLPYRLLIDERSLPGEGA